VVRRAFVHSRALLSRFFRFLLRRGFRLHMRDVSMTQKFRKCREKVFFVDT
jgi:hypothetical protein